jgi:hypothetical protein
VSLAPGNALAIKCVVSCSAGSAPIA